MKIYLAALHSNGYRHTNRYKKLNEREKWVVDHLPHLLESYHYIHKPNFVNAIRDIGDKIFLDSGAFSSFTLGVKIDLPGYVRYIQENDDIIARDDGVVLASVLDGIGDPQETLDNQKEMERLGFSPLPCFHAGEDESFLEYYVKNYEYITLGGMVRSSPQQLMIWLDRMWEKYLTDGSGRPRLKVHGFGITSVPLMKRYPWWSCDSSTWIQNAAFGSVVTPQHGPIAVSTKSPNRHNKGQHIDSMNDYERAQLMQLFESQWFEYERLSTIYESRAAYNLWAFTIINEMINRKGIDRFVCAQPELF